MQRLTLGLGPNPGLGVDKSLNQKSEVPSWLSVHTFLLLFIRRHAFKYVSANELLQTRQGQLDQLASARLEEARTSSARLGTFWRSKRQ